MDGQRRIVESNPAALRLLGSRNGGLAGKTLLEATLSYEFISLLNAAQETDQSQQQEIRRSSDAASRILRVSISPLQGLDGAACFSGFAGRCDGAAAAGNGAARFCRECVARTPHSAGLDSGDGGNAAGRGRPRRRGSGAVSSISLSGEVERLTRILEDLLVLSPRRVETAGAQCFSAELADSRGCGTVSAAGGKKRRWRL